MSADAITVYHYPNCSSCKKARRWFDENGLEVQLVHMVEQTPDVATLRALLERSKLPIKKFFNTSGGSYRAGGFGARLPSMSQDEALEALAADGMLIKRPIIDAGETVLVGFKAESYAAALLG